MDVIILLVSMILVSFTGLSYMIIVSRKDTRSEVETIKTSLGNHLSNISSSISDMKKQTQDTVSFQAEVVHEIARMARSGEMVTANKVQSGLKEEVQKEIERLVAKGVLIPRTKGRITYYELKDKKLLYPEKPRLLAEPAFAKGAQIIIGHTPSSTDRD